MSQNLQSKEKTQTPVSAGKTAANTRRTVLDGLESGTDEYLAEYANERAKVVVPKEVKKKEVYADILALAWPTFVELTLASLANMIDMMMVGNLGHEAISSVSIAAQPKFILNTVFMAMCTGSTALIARCRGAGDRDRANHFLRQSLIITFVLSAVSTILGLLFSRPLILLMGDAEETVVKGGIEYLKWQLYSLIPMSLTFAITSALRGVGKNRVSMVYNVTANVINVIFNYLLIEGHWGFPAWGIKGASIATAIGQIVAFIIAVVVIAQPKQYLHISFKQNWKPDFGSIKEVGKIGIPAMFEQVMMRIGVVIFTRQVVSLGSVHYATHNVCMNINSMSFMTGNAFANSATALMGQSLGKKRPDMGVVYTSYTRRCGLIFALLMCACFALFGGTVVSWYNKEPEIIQAGKLIMLFVAFMQPFQNAQFITAGALRGAGDTKAIAKIILVTTVGVRAGLAVLILKLLEANGLKADYGIYGAWAALVLDQLLRSFLVIRRYNTGKWKKVRVNIK